MDERKHRVERPDGDEDEDMIDLSKKKIHQLEDIINFGKHKGKTIEDVLNRHPDYLLWAQDAIEWFEVDDSILEAAAEKVENKRSNRRGEVWFGDDDNRRNEYGDDGDPDDHWRRG